MSEDVVDIRSKPVIIHLLTNRGHLSSPPIELEPEQTAVEHTFELKATCFINGWVVAHDDGLVFYADKDQMLSMSPGPFTVRANIDEVCQDPDCTRCSKLS